MTNSVISKSNPFSLAVWSGINQRNFSPIKHVKGVHMRISLFFSYGRKKDGDLPGLRETLYNNNNNNMNFIYTVL